MGHQNRSACPQRSGLRTYEVRRPTGWGLPFHFGEVCGGLRNIGLEFRRDARTLYTPGHRTDAVSDDGARSDGSARSGAPSTKEPRGHEKPLNMERSAELLHAARRTVQISALVEQNKDVHRGLERYGTLSQHLQRQLQKVPGGVEPDTLKPISAVLDATHELVEGLTGLRANRHGYFHGSWYRQQLDTMERRLGLLSEILESELTRGLGTPDDDEPTLHQIIADELAQEFWRVAFGRNVVEVPAGQFFACVERIIDGDDWLDFACLSQALDPKRSGRVEISRFAEFVEAENGLVRGLHKYATAPTAVYACGSNRMGECGQAALVQDHLEHPTLLKVLADRTVRQIDCDSGSSAALLANGDLYTWGSNSLGKLGHGDVSGADGTSGSCGAPRLIQAFQGIPIRQVSCGTTFMAAVAEDGRLFTWGGYSAHAQHSPTLGHDPGLPGLQMQRGPGDTPFVSMPVQVASLEMPISQVACGTEHAAAITAEGRLYCWGGGERGRLGIGNEEDYHTPQLVSALEDRAICQVSCGTFHTLALTTDGMVYAWGSGKDGKLGLGDVAYCPFFERDTAGQPFVSKPQLLSAMASVPIVQVSAGSAHSAAVSEDGAVYTFGCGKCGKLGHGGTGAEWLPKRVEGARGADVTQASCGRDHTAVVTSHGEMLTWGHGERGRLGNGMNSGVEAKPRVIHGMRGRALQVQCGRFHTLIMAGEQEMSEHEFDTLERMLEDRLGVREAEGKASMERYRTTTGKKRRRRRHVNRLGQEEYLSETETEQSELDLAPDVQRLIVEESEMYHEKMEECEELKDQVDQLRKDMQEMQLQMEAIEHSRKQAEVETHQLKMRELQAKAKSHGPTDAKNLSGPSADVQAVRSGYLMKASGGKKDASGKKVRSVGSMRTKWDRRWFVLVNDDVDLDGDGMPDMGLYYYKSEEAQKNGEKPSGRVELLGVKITTETEPKTNETIMILDSDFRTIKIKDDPKDDEDIDITDWIPDLEQVIARQEADPFSISTLGAAPLPGADVEPGSPSALEAHSAPQVGGDLLDPARASVSSAEGEYGLGGLPPPPTTSAPTTAQGSAPLIPVPQPQSALEERLALAKEKRRQAAPGGTVA